MHHHQRKAPLRALSIAALLAVLPTQIACSSAKPVAESHVKSPAPARGIDEDARKSALKKAAELYRAGDIEGAIKALKDLDAKGNAKPEDIAGIGGLLAESGREEEALLWYRRAVQITKARSEPSSELTLLLAGSLMRLGRPHELIKELEAALQEPKFDREDGLIYEALTEAYDATKQPDKALRAAFCAVTTMPTEQTWELFEEVQARTGTRVPQDVAGSPLKLPPRSEVERVVGAGSWGGWTLENMRAGATAYVAYAEALQKDGRQGPARSFRKAAALGAIRAGIAALQRKNPSGALDAFAVADSASPVSELHPEVQMPLLQAMALAYARRGLFTHAFAAVQQVFDLCKPTSATSKDCRLNAFALSPYRPSSPDLDPVMQVNLKVLGKVIQIAFESVSWEPLSGHPRTRDHSEFVGHAVTIMSARVAPTQRHVSHPRHEEGNHAAIVAKSVGIPYGMVSPEEDRVELQTVMAANREELKIRLREHMRAGHHELAVKTMLAEMLLLLQLGAWMPDPTATWKVLDMPVEELDQSIASSKVKLPEGTLEAYRLGKAAMGLLEGIDKSYMRFGAD